MYVKTENGSVVSYPYEPEQLRTDNPRTSFPKPIPDDMLSEYGIFPVIIPRPDYDVATQRVQYDGEPTLANGVWTLEASVVPLTDTQLADKLAAKREQASLPKAEFCIGLIGLGILTTDDAVSASRGNWPAAMNDFLNFLTPEQSAQVQIEWATHPTIWRTNTFVLSLASFANLTDETVDALFGG